MRRLLGAIVTLAVLGTSSAAAWAPIARGRRLLSEQLGAHETIGWAGPGLRLLYTVLISAALLTLVLWPVHRLLARAKRRTLHRLELLGQCLAFGLMLWVLLLPAFLWAGLGLVNALWDRSPPEPEVWRFVGVTSRNRGPDRVEWARADDPGETLALFEIRPPPGSEPGALVTLYRRRGALGMRYLSTLP